MRYLSRVMDNEISLRSKLISTLPRNEISQKGKILSGNAFGWSNGKIVFTMELNEGVDPKTVKAVYDKKAAQLGMEASSLNKITKTKVKSSTKMGKSQAYSSSETIAYRYSLQYS